MSVQGSPKAVNRFFVPALCLLLGVQSSSAFALSGEEDGDGEGIRVTTVEEAPVESSPHSFLDEETIEALGPRSAQDLLQSMPGLHLARHGSEGKAAQFFIHGFDASHGTDITLSIGNLVLNEPSHIHGHGYADTGLLIPEALRRVTLRKGPFELDQGNLSTAGAARFELGAPSQRGLHTGVELGYPFRSRVFSLYSHEDWARSEVLALEAVYDQGPYQNRDTLRAGVLGQREVRGFRVRGGLSWADFGLPGAVPLRDINAGILDFGETYTPDTRGRTAQFWFGGVWSTRFQQWTQETSLDLRARQFEARENFTGFLLYPEEGDESRETHQAIGAVLQQEGSGTLSSALELYWIGGAKVDWFEQREERRDREGISREMLRGGEGWQGSLFLGPGVRWKPHPDFELQVGGRGELFLFDFREIPEVGGERGRQVVGVVAPRARATYYAGNRWIFRGALGRGYRGPEARVVASPDEVPADEDLRFYRGGRPEVTTVDGLEFGTIFEPFEHVELGATIFGYFSEAEFLYDHISRLTVDLGRTRRLGSELAASYRVPEKFHLRGHLAMVQGRFPESGEPIPFAPPLEGGIMAHGTLQNGLRLGGQIRALGPRPLTFGAQAPGQVIADIHGGYRWGRFDFRLHVENLLDSRWFEGMYHYPSRHRLEEPRSSLPKIHVVPGHPRGMRFQMRYLW